MPAAQPDTKVALLQALARRGDKSAAAVFVSAAADADPAVQAAAVGGLGSLGTPAQAPLLLTLAANGAKPVQDAARQSLQLLAGIDTALTGALQQPDAKFRAEAARALAARHAVAATGSIDPGGYAGQRPWSGVEQLECSTWNIPALPAFSDAASDEPPSPGCSTWNTSSRQKLNHAGGVSPACGSVRPKSTLLREIRGGVPVFNRPSSSPASFSDPDISIAASSPARPPDFWVIPI